MSKSVDEAWLSTKESERRLTDRELEMYPDHRHDLLKWMLEQGQAPSAHVGYAEETVKNRASRLDILYRWVWDIEERYTEDITVTHVNAFMKYVGQQPYSSSYKAAFQKAIFTLFRWQRHEQGKRVKWKPEYRYKDSSYPGSPPALTREDRTALREASISYGSLPHYNSVSPEERKKWTRYLAQLLGKPMKEVGKDDWEKANSWKWPSLIWTAIDGGLRPKEVSRAKVSWLDSDAGVLRIPAEDSVKNSASWTVSLRDRTVSILEKWIKERSCYEKYEDSELLWLTKYSNPYESNSLNPWFRKLCDEAGIDHKQRGLSWYSIRHSVGREMVREKGVGAAAEQLRHKSMNSTLRYIRASPEERKDALERMG